MNNATPVTGPYGAVGLDLQNKDWLPIPVVGKDRPPAGYTGRSGADPSYADVHAWTTGPEATHNVAVRLSDGMVGIDVDAHSGKVGASTMGLLVALLGEIPATWRSTSRDDSASGIYFYRVPPGTDLCGAEKAVREIGPHVDIIHSGHRYALVAPSVHPDTSAVYQWRDPHGAVCDAPKVDEVPWLPQPWVAFCTRTIVERATGEDPVWTTAKPPPGDDWSAVIGVGSRHQTVLRRVGWMRSIGMPQVAAEAAALGWQQLCEQRSDNPFTVDDVLALVRDVYARYPAGETSTATEPEWRELEPLTPRRTLPVFPVDVLPGWVAAMVRNVAAATATPVDLAGMMALACMAAALCGRITVTVWPGWVERLVLYCLVAMDPSSRKSPVFKVMTEALFDAEALLVKEGQDARTEAEVDRQIRQRQIERAVREAANGSGKATSDGRIDAVSAMRELAKIAEKTVPPRLIADDVTPEGLVQLIGRHEFISILSSEGGSLLTASGKRYAEAAHLDLVLKSWSGDPFRTDRASAAPIMVKQPGLVIGMTVQPRVIDDLVAVPEFCQRGLISRFLVALPVDTVGSRPFRTSPVDEAVGAVWHERLRDAAMTFYLGEAATIRMSDEAIAILQSYHAEIEPRLGVTGDLGTSYGWGGKAVGTAARIAAILEVMDGLTILKGQPATWPAVVTVHKMQSAVAIMRYLEAHVRAAIEGAGVDGATTDARLVWARIKRSQATRVKLRDLGRWLPALDRDRLMRALDALEDHGYVRRVPPTRREGRPSIEYDVRPDGREAP